MEETAIPVFFGEWLKRRRRGLDLTQAELAQRAGCSVFALRKIEAGDRRPSKQLAGLLARSLEIPVEEQTNFIKAARGELSVARLPSPAREISDIYHPASMIGLHPGNLPGMLTPFIGREPELTALSLLLEDPQCRLLTLVGLGGIGKTRLAIEIAARHKDLFPDGAWFVSLAPINSSGLLVPTIADALGFRFQDPTKPRDQLLNYLREKEALLVLDNVEHLLDGVYLFGEILESSPQVKLLVTSRERLNLLSEWVFEIHGLPVPTSDKAERFEEYSSVALFVQSARRVQASFDLQEGDRSCVARICQIVEGMPLGIELAAAWAGLLSCSEIALEIERNLDFLRVSMRDLPERHRSLRATLDYSWNLLSPEEKAILSRLAVFRGSFRREAAEEICGASLMILSSLKDKSLLRRTDQGRYDLHDLIQQYAALKLAEDTCGDEAVKDQHAFYYVQQLSEWEKALKSARQVETFTEMAHEIDNLRQAWQRMVTCCELNCKENFLFTSSLFHTSLFSLSLFYEMRCRNWEAINLFRDSLEGLKAVCDRFDLIKENPGYKTALGHITAYLGLHYAYILQYQQAHELLEEALSILENCQARVEKAQAQIMLAWLFQKQGQLHKSIVLLEESRIIFQEEGDGWWYILTISLLAWAYLSIGKIQESNALYQEGLRQVCPGDLRLSVPLKNGFAYACFMQNDYAKAERLLQENLQFSLQLGNNRQTAINYLDLGQVALATNRIELAEKNLQECVDLLSEFGESHDLALGLVHLGKCLAARNESESARKIFQQVIQIGQAINTFYLVYWGLVNLARINMVEGKPEKALEMALILRQYSVEIKVVQDDGNHLMDDLLERFSQEQIDAFEGRIEGHTIESLVDQVYDRMGA